jgi:uncharacterized membrane protein
MVPVQLKSNQTDDDWGVDVMGTRVGKRERHASVSGNRGIKVVHTVTIDRPAEELFHFWRQLENLPLFITHLIEVKTIDATRSHWVAAGPARRTVEWDAEIINEHENSLIGWGSCEGSDVDHAGSVRFEAAPPGKGTEVRVSLEYVPPAGAIGKWIAIWLGGWLEQNPAHQIQDDMRAFKALMETGEIPSVRGQPFGRGRSS